jgi:hypothetical protein
LCCLRGCILRWGWLLGDRLVWNSMAVVTSSWDSQIAGGMDTKDKYECSNGSVQRYIMSSWQAEGVGNTCWDGLELWDIPEQTRLHLGEALFSFLKLITLSPPPLPTSQQRMPPSSGKLTFCPATSQVTLGSERFLEPSSVLYIIYGHLSQRCPKPSLPS